MTYRERPYSQFRFQVKLGDENAPDPATAEGGFQEVQGLGVEVTVAEYRNGYESNWPRKVHGLVKYTDVTLKRGVIGHGALWDWLKLVMQGLHKDDDKVRRNVTISLLSEDGTDVAQSWSLKEARPIKYTGPQLAGKGTDIAIEELVLSIERMETEFPG